MAYFNMFITTMSHITAALYLQKPKYNKAFMTFFWGVYVVFSIYIMTFQENHVVGFWSMLLLQGIIFYITSIGSAGEKVFLFLTYANSFCICIGARMILSVFMDTACLGLSMLPILILMHIFLYKVLIFIYRKSKVFITSGWWKLNVILIFFLIQFVNQYAFSTIHRNNVGDVAVDFVIFSIVFYLTLILTFDMIKSVALLNRKMYENSELEKIAYLDILTNMQNRVAYMKFAKRQVLNHRYNKNSSFVFVMMDVDGFKNINDTKGHAAGDEILKCVGTVIQEHFKGSECESFRIGGDEFVLLFENMELSDIEDKIKKMNKKLYNLNGIRLSYGCCKVDFNHTKPFEEAYKKADAIMYSHKQKYYSR